MKRFLALIVTFAMIITSGLGGNLGGAAVGGAFAADLPASTAPKAGDITVTNNAQGTADTVYVDDLSPKDVVRVYSAASGGKLLGSATVSGNGYAATVKIPQLGTDAGNAYVTVTNTGCAESKRVKVSYAAESVSAAPSSDDIVVTNNAHGTYDTVYVTNLMPKDIVRVYSAYTGGKLLGSATVSSTGYQVTIKIAELGMDAGSVYISVTSTDCLESPRTEADYGAEPVSTPPDPSSIVVTNNAQGTYDTVYVTNLLPKDIIKVYNLPSGGKLLGSATVSSTGYQVTIKIAQLGTTAGSVWVTDTNTACLESTPVEADYAAEPGTDTPGDNSIVVTNNPAGTSDTVYVSGLNPKDVVKVYNAAVGGSLLGSGTVGASADDVTVKITQLGTGAGSVFVSVTGSGKLESSRTEADYGAEQSTPTPSASNITVTNNSSGTPDTVYVSGLSSGDIVKVYSAPAGGNLLGSGTVASGNSDVTVKINQLGTGAGSVYVSVTTSGMDESPRVEADYSAEASTDAPDPSLIAVTNNPVGTADSIYVGGLESGDVVKAYSSATGGTLLGEATSTGSSVTISVTQLGASAGSVYITVTATGKAESSRVEADYSAEASSSAPSADNIVVDNNASGTADTVYVGGLKESDVVNVYRAAVGGSPLGTGTVAAGADSVTISITQLGTDAGTIYVTVTSANSLESSRVAVSYDAESQTTAPDASDISVVNNVGTADTVTVSGLKSGDVVNVYDSATGGTQLGTATAGDNGLATVSINQLGTDSGTVYVTLTSKNMRESSRTAVSYDAESQTTAPDASDISVVNNVGVADTVTVSGLEGGDVVNVYSTATSSTVLGTATAGQYATSATVSINQLGSAAGTVYVTLTRTNMKESSRTAADYDAESQTPAPDASDISIVNNAGEADTVTVSGLEGGDVVNVYSSATSGTVLGTATAGQYATSAVVSINQLGSAAGTVYVTLTRTNMSESSRTAAAYSAEAQSTAPDADNITVENNYLSSSTVTVGNLNPGDIVNVYDAATGGNLLGTGTVSANTATVTISVNNLSSAGGTVYVTVTSTGKAESGRTAVTYSAKATTAAPDESAITVVNNAGIADTVTVKGVSTGTVINVYSAEDGGDLLGTATATGASVTVSIDQLGSGSGTVYVSATDSGKLESTRTAADYDAEAASDPIQAGNVTIVNNSGAADTITVTGLSDGDVVSAYKSSSGGSAIATATADDSLTATINIAQLGTSAGSIYLTVTSTGKTESSRTEVSYSAESTAPSADDITIVNNAGIPDTITVSDLNPGDVVKVYDAASNGNLLGSATVASSSTSAQISVNQLSSAAGYVYVSVTNSGCAPSSLTKAAYIAEQTTQAPDVSNVYIVNNHDEDDTITVYNLQPGDNVMVYDTDDNLLGRATVAAGDDSATVSVDDLGSGAGSVYVTVKETGKLESDATEVPYSAESKTSAPYVGDITVTNSASNPTVTVTNLDSGEVVKVYDSDTDGKLLGSATVPSGSTQATVTLASLTNGSGTVYVSVTELGRSESDCTAANYSAQS